MRGSTDQHGRFVREVLIAVERVAREIADATAFAAKNPDECISDTPRGSPGYNHVYTLPNGVTISIRRVDPQKPSEGMQLEVCRPNATKVRVPRDAPYIPWTPDDAELAPIADGVAPYVLAVLAGVTEVGHTGPIPGYVLF